MRAIVTVIGKDRVGIIASVCTLLSQHNVNVLDISQTILESNFVMSMLVDTSSCTIAFADLASLMEQEGEKLNLSIRIQLEDIFNAMHRI